MIGSVPPWIRCCIRGFSSHSLLRKCLEHDAEHGLSVVLGVHLFPPIEKLSHGWYMVASHICRIKVLDRRPRPSFRCTEDVVKTVVGGPRKCIPCRDFLVSVNRAEGLKFLHVCLCFFGWSGIDNVDIYGRLPRNR
jgi:hypothetical protein